MGKKKPFIDKKHSVRFHLVHRGQRDPLQADSEAPEMVLHHVGENKEAGEKEEQKEFGIYFDDEYDYLQHLKPRGDGVLVMADDGPSQSTSASKTTSYKDVGGIKLPSEALPSELEEDQGMLDKGCLPRGPQPDWDPDIVEALDDGLNLDDPTNILEDDFMMLANGEGALSHQVNYDDDYDSGDAYSDPEFGSDDFGFGEESFDQFENEETKSRFTNYSMTSSVMRRTQGLQLIDNKFEKLMEEYDDDQIGSLEEEDGDNEVAPQERFLVDQAMEDLNVHHGKGNLEVEKRDTVTNEDFQEDHNEDAEEFEKVVEPEKERWDCESIISTYSNIYNHPKLITEPKAIKLTKRLAIPSDVLKKKYQGDTTGTDTSAASRNMDTSNHLRKKDETKNEKKNRKAAIKEERRNRRVEKKSNKLAFKDEQKLQERIFASQKIKSSLPM